MKACRLCDGHCEIKCEECNGGSYFKCPTCLEFTVVCENCNGKGFFTCSECNGEGLVEDNHIEVFLPRDSDKKRMVLNRLIRGDLIVEFEENGKLYKIIAKKP